MPVAVGGTLAKAAFGYANLTGLKPVARTLLVWMALRALDDDSPTGQPAARSFMKRSELAVGIGRMMPDREPSPDAPPEEHQAWDADDQAVARALRVLKAVKAIREVGSARLGRVSEFDICLGVSEAEGVEGKSQNVALDPSKKEPAGVRSVTFRESKNVAPTNNLKNHKEQQRGQPSASRASHLQPVDNFMSDSIVIERVSA